MIRVDDWPAVESRIREVRSMKSSDSCTISRPPTHGGALQAKERLSFENPREGRDLSASFIATRNQEGPMGNRQISVFGTAVLERFRMLGVVGLALGTCLVLAPWWKGEAATEVAANAVQGDRQVLERILAEQSDAWNRGDIATFMEAYWKSPDLTFSSGGATTRGWEATRDRYLKKYPDRATMGTLEFSQLEVRLLGDEAALMLGRWHLQREEPVGGNFSLVWQKIDGLWVIVHDHTSVSPAATSPATK